MLSVPVFELCFLVPEFDSLNHPRPFAYMKGCDCRPLSSMSCLVVVRLWVTRVMLAALCSDGAHPVILLLLLLLLFTTLMTTYRGFSVMVVPVKSGCHANREVVLYTVIHCTLVPALATYGQSPGPSHCWRKIQYLPSASPRVW